MWLIESLLVGLMLLEAAVAIPTSLKERWNNDNSKTIKPKVFIISMFADEANVWRNRLEFNVFAKNITVPGFSPLFPAASCTSDGSICLLTTGEGEINAASTISALVLSPSFDLTSTYFLIAGVAGINPKIAATGSVTFAKYAVQVGLQHEIDAREKPQEFPTGYIPLGAKSPDQYPVFIYGTEVFEVNEALMKKALEFAKTASLDDTQAAAAYRANYASESIFEAGASAPKVVQCDTATSDTWWSGTLLGEAFENTTKLFTNGHATYCTTQQEDNGTLEALLRATLNKKVDYSRIIVMRTGSDYDRQHDGQSAADNLFSDEGQEGYPPALENIYRAGVKVVKGIVDEWDKTFRSGIYAHNYLGDILGSLGGMPDFAPPKDAGERTAPNVTSRRLGRRL